MPLISRLHILCPRFLLLSLWLCLITMGSLLPAPSAPVTDFSAADKIVHGCAYGILTLLASWYVARHRPLTTPVWLLLVAGVIVYGGLVELAQGAFTRERTPEFADFAANAFGVMGAFSLMAAFGRSRKK